jgi:hypothetical protein
MQHGMPCELIIKMGRHRSQPQPSPAPKPRHGQLAAAAAIHRPPDQRPAATRRLDLRLAAATRHLNHLPAADIHPLRLLNRLRRPPLPMAIVRLPRHSEQRPIKDPLRQT